MDATVTHCRFDHPGFTLLGTGVFRLTQDDKVPALAMRVDATDVVVPLPAVARLFAIQPNSPDGRMLQLIEQALRFVPQIQLGDALPSEVLTGEASWAPSEVHRKTATAKLHLQLLNWISGAVDSDETLVTGQILVVSMDDPSIRPRIQDALRRAATTLGIEGGQNAVSTLIEELAQELAYIEALREWLLERARTMLKRLSQAGHELGVMAPARRETLFQVVRLATTAVADIASAFDAVDAQTSEVGPALRNLGRHRTFLRSHRDPLYSTMLEWQPLLSAWDTVPKATSKDSDGIWRVVDDTYRFLAPRFMTVQEWQSRMTGSERPDKAKTVLVW